MVNRRDFLRLTALAVAVAGVALGGLGGVLNTARADSGIRFVEAHLNPGAFGINGETIDLSQFQMEYFSTDDPNVFAYEMSNAVNPDGYLTLRGTFTVNDGETKVLDSLGALANELTAGETLGSTGSPFEMPGTESGIDNIYELHSALGASNPWFNFIPTGKKTFSFDLDSDYVQGHIDLIQTTVESWRQMPAGYEAIGDLADFTTYHSNQGEPEGFNQGEHKVWKIQGIETNLFRGQILIAEDKILFSKSGATQSTMDEEILSAMIINESSPFANQILPVVPEAYKKYVAMMGFTDIRTENGEVIPLYAIGGSGYNRALYTKGADDGTGIPPGSINPDNLVQQDRFDSNGYVISSITEPPVSIENSSFGSIKAMFR